MTLTGRTIDSPHIVRLGFAQDAVAASQSDVDLPRTETGGGATAVDGYVAPWDGEIVAMGVTLSAAATAGQADVVPVVAATAQTEPAVTVTTATDETATHDRSNPTTFTAGDVLGVQLTTDGDWDATTADLAVDLYVVYEVTG